MSSPKLSFTEETVNFYEKTATLRPGFRHHFMFRDYIIPLNLPFLIFGFALNQNFSIRIRQGFISNEFSVLQI